MSRVVLIMFMVNEDHVARLAVKSLLPQLRPNDSVLVLLNGATSEQLAEHYGSLPQVHFFQSKENLGVAGGRNFLLRTEQVRNADLIYLVDNDTIAPIDYLDKLQAFHASLDNPGIIGPLTLNWRVVCQHTPEFRLENVQKRLDAKAYFDCAEVWRRVKDHMSVDMIDHVGMDPSGEYAYFSAESLLSGLISELSIGRVKFRPNALKFQSGTLYEVLGGTERTMRVSNLPGCCQTFSRALLDEIGELDESFSPYGFEDADFALRALEAGKTNAASLDTILLHRTDSRHTVRADGASAYASLVNQHRARGILDANHHSDAFPKIAIRRALANELRGQPNIRRAEFVGSLSGIKQACQQLYLRDRAGYHRALETGDDAERRFLAGAVHALPQARGDALVEKEAAPLIERLAVRDDELRRRFNPRTYLDLRTRSHIDSGTGGFNVRQHGGAKQDSITPFDTNKIKGLRDKFKGERCFIVGNGPSLNRTDLSFLRNEYTFGVNSIYLMQRVNGFVPTFYTVEDNHVVDDNLEEIINLDVRYKFFPARYRNALGESERNIYLPVNWEFYFGSSPYFNMPRFGIDITKYLYVGQTVTYLNFQIARYLGFSDIYLIGVDFDYKVPDSASIKGNSILSNEDDPNHFHPTYFGKGKKWHLPKLENCYRAYQHAHRTATDGGFRILDATIDGKLDAFPKARYGEVVGAQGDCAAPNTPAMTILRASLPALAGAYKEIALDLTAAGSALNDGISYLTLNIPGLVLTREAEHLKVLAGSALSGTCEVKIVSASHAAHYAAHNLASASFDVLLIEVPKGSEADAVWKAAVTAGLSGLDVTHFGKVVCLSKKDLGIDIADVLLSIAGKTPKPLRRVDPQHLRVVNPMLAVMKSAAPQTGRFFYACYTHPDDGTVEPPSEGGENPWPKSRTTAASLMALLAENECPFALHAPYIYFVG